ncbi:MAG: TonB-dependent receptor [Acidimicrobiia bacterium]|nr:TonB-dependent receptor [Acidimicrobiia bacterium]
MAQTSTSAISGTVSDSSGGVIPGAAVTATNEATGISYKQNTTDAGLYAFSALPVGSYTITVELQGFKTAKRTGSLLQVGSPITVDVQMEVGQTAETVLVESSFEQLQTSNATIGNVVERKAIVELPLNGRNPLNLLILEPGVVQRTQGGAGSGVHVNGSRDRAFNTTIDGIEANESSVPNPLNNVFRLNPDNVQEYKVTTSNPTPEEGRNSGASVAVATRTGTNAFHGTLFHFFRNTVLNSNDFFARAQETPKPDIKLNQFGFEVGGPVRKNKTFFFASWQGQRINFTQPIDQVFGGPAIVYTPEALAGQWRYFRINPTTPFTLDGVRINRNLPQLVDPRTGALRSGVRTCGSNTDLNCVATYNMFSDDPRRIGGDPTILKLLNTFPRPNSYVAGDGLNMASYVWNPPTRVRGPHLMGRIDHTFNENNTIFGRYLFSDNNTLGGDPNNSRPQVFPGFAPLGEVVRRSQNLAVSYRRVINPRIVNELTFGFSRFAFIFTQGEANPAFPDIPPFDFANISEPYLNRPRTARAVTTPQILNNLSVVSGSHVFRMGFNGRFYQHNDQRGQPGGVNVTPVISFSRTIRPPVGFNLPGVATATQGGIVAQDSNNLQQGINELLGIPARLTQVFLGDLRSDAFLPFRTGNSVTLWSQGQRVKQYNFYFQDEWKLRRDMTLNYGVRAELNPGATEAGDRVYVPQGDLNSSQVAFVNSKRWYSNDNVLAVGPRFGITWNPGNGKTVIRSGYGISFDPISSFQITAAAGRVPGLSTSCQANPGGSTTAGCSPAPDRRINEGFPLELTPPTTKPTSFLKQPSQTLNAAPAATFFDQSLKMPTVHQWNLNVQRELPQGLVAQIGYIGKRGTRLLRAYDLNQINAEPILEDFLNMQRNVNNRCQASGTGCPAGVSGIPIGLVNRGVVNAAFVNSAATAAELSQNAAGLFVGRVEQSTVAGFRPNSQFGTITYIDSGGDSYYHSFQSTLRKRFSNGLHLAASYTLAKSIDNQSVDPVGSTSGGGLSTTNSRTPADIRNWRNERAVSDFDRRHVFNGIWLYELPFGANKSFGAGARGFVNHLIGGWSINGIFSAMTSEPFTVQSGVRTSNNSHVSRAALAVSSLPKAQLQDRANTVGPVFFPDNTMFAFPAPGDNGLARNMFRGSGYWNTDIGLQKMVQLKEGLRLQVRMETFNTFNHPSFETPTASSSGSNQITSARFAEACCAAVAPSSTQNIIQTGESGRVVQFALKMIF